MAKNPSRKAVRKDEPMTGAMKFFLAGCVAELYLLILRRFYINAGSDLIRIAWYDKYLWVIAGIGAAVMLVGIVGALALKGTRKKALWLVTAAGAFVGLTTLFVRLNMSSLAFMTTLVPVIMILGLLWGLYDRECALSLTVLGAALFGLWVLRRYGTNIRVGGLVKACVVGFVLLLAVLAWLTKAGKLTRLLPPRADKLTVYVSCGIAAVALLAALLISGASYYAMWALAAVVFALAVYYTVKQL